MYRSSVTGGLSDSHFANSSREKSTLPYVPLPHTLSIVGSIRATKLELLKGLEHAEKPEGWMDPSGGSAQMLWTAIGVLNSLIESGAFPHNYVPLITQIINSEKQRNELCGWEHEGFANHISVYLTGDVIRLYLTLRRYDALKEIVDSLQKMQNDDGGWGVCSGDRLSKVRSTSGALCVLLNCLNLPPTQSLVKEKVVNEGIKWLYNAQNDREEDSGWGDLPDHLPSNVTATAFALDALLEAIKYYRSHRTSIFSIREDAIKRGLLELINMGSNGYWRGAKEEFGIQINGQSVGRHILVGPGTTIVVQILIKAFDLGLLTTHNIIYDGVADLIKRCKNYQGFEGAWLMPSDDGGAPLAWNSAFALDALNSYEKYFMRYLAGCYIEKSVYNELTKHTRFWQRGTAVFLLSTIGFILAPLLRTFGQLPLWFAQLPIFYQGLILIGVSVAVEQLYSRVVRGLAFPALRTLLDRLRQ